MLRKIGVLFSCFLLMGVTCFADSQKLPTDLLYRQQLSDGLEGLGNEFDELSLLEVATQNQSQVPDPFATPLSANPVSVCVLSGCGVSVCALSGCGGSVCALSGCAASVCVIWCPGSGTGSSACAGSACGFSGCAGSVCVGSNCTGSICDGSACTNSSCNASTCTSSFCTGSGCNTSNCTGTACITSTCACPLAPAVPVDVPAPVAKSNSWNGFRIAPVQFASLQSNGKLELASMISGEHIVRYALPGEDRMSWSKLNVSANVMASVTLPQGARVLDVITQ
jgi:hypothetical protein